MSERDIIKYLPEIIFFFNDTATTEIYTLSLHDALPIFDRRHVLAGAAVHDVARAVARRDGVVARSAAVGVGAARSEEHTSELQSRQYLVCRLLLEKKQPARWYNIVMQLPDPLSNDVLAT